MAAPSGFSGEMGNGANSGVDSGFSGEYDDGMGYSGSGTDRFSGFSGEYDDGAAYGSGTDRLLLFEYISRTWQLTLFSSQHGLLNKGIN